MRGKEVVGVDYLLTKVVSLICFIKNCIPVVMTDVIILMLTTAVVLDSFEGAAMLYLFPLVTTVNFLFVPVQIAFA